MSGCALPLMLGYHVAQPSSAQVILVTITVKTWAVWVLVTVTIAVTVPLIPTLVVTRALLGMSVVTIACAVTAAIIVVPIVSLRTMRVLTF